MPDRQPRAVADERSAIRVCVTLDIDMQDHVTGREIDEFQAAIPAWMRILEQRPWIRATWFVRIDRQMAVRLGEPDGLLARHAETVAAWRDLGHEIAWHLHSYRRQGDRWVQQCDERQVADELNELAPLARARGMTALRMGWGFHTTQTMNAAARQGLTADSSAIPRPRYEWEQSHKDWQGTPRHPYRPAAADYRRPGEEALPIWEIPMSVARVAAPYDTGPIVRYLNAAYHQDIFQRALEDWFAQQQELVLITHPHEVLPRPSRHGLLACDVHAAAENLDAVVRFFRKEHYDYRFMSITELAADCERDLAVSAQASACHEGLLPEPCGRVRGELDRRLTIQNRCDA